MGRSRLRSLHSRSRQVEAPERALPLLPILPFKPDAMPNGPIRRQRKQVTPILYLSYFAFKLSRLWVTLFARGCSAAALTDSGMLEP